MADYKGILVFGESSEGKISSITTEILGCGRQLADELQEELTCVLMGDQLGDTPQQSIAYGADKVYAVDDP